jgi:hypothetical protein
MPISLKTHKMLWGRSGNRCAICRQELVVDATETDDESLIGEESHIVAREKDGPRGNSELDDESRDKYDNLVLLCRNHHKVVDDQFVVYTVEKLHEIKRSHEEWIRSTLSTYDPKKQRDDEYYAGIIDEFSARAHLDDWRTWSSWVFAAGQPQLDLQVDESLHGTRDWLLSRVWPGRYPQLEDALTNFRLVLQDFQNTFHEHSKKAPDIFYTRKFYQIDEWNPEKYERLYDEYAFHCSLVEDLMLELTRAGNYACDMVRQYLFPSFRLQEGVLLVVRGPFMGFNYRTYRAEYRGDERIACPYPGLQRFKDIRQNRDFAIGYGSTAAQQKTFEEKMERDASGDGCPP